MATKAINTDRQDWEGWAEWAIRKTDRNQEWIADQVKKRFGVPKAQVKRHLREIFGDHLQARAKKNAMASMPQGKKRAVLDQALSRAALGRVEKEQERHIAAIQANRTS